MKKGSLIFKSMSSVAIDLFGSIFPGDTIKDSDIPKVAEGLAYKLNPEQQSMLIANLMRIRNKEIAETQRYLDRLSQDKVCLKVSMDRGFRDLVPMLDRA